MLIIGLTRNARRVRVRVPLLSGGADGREAVLWVSAYQGAGRQIKLLFDGPREVFVIERENYMGPKARRDGAMSDNCGSSAAGAGEAAVASEGEGR